VCSTDLRWTHISKQKIYFKKRESGRELKWNFDKKTAIVIKFVVANKFLVSQERQIYFSINLIK